MSNISQVKFDIIEEQTSEYRRSNTRSTQWKVRLNLLPTNSAPTNYFVASVNELFDHMFDNVNDGDMVGITIHNEINQSDKSIGFSFRRKVQISSDIIKNVFDKISSLFVDLTPWIR